MNRAKQLGSALVEAVLVIPILLTLIASTYELGSLFQQYLIIQQMAYEGARAGSQLDADSLPTTPSCYSINTSGRIRGGGEGAAEALAAILARVDAMITQNGNVLKLTCDDRQTNHRCSLPVNANLASYAAEYIPDSAANVAIGCGYPPPPYTNSQALLGKKGTIGVTVSGKYTGRVFPFSLYLSAESRGMLLAENQDYSPPKDVVPPSSSYSPVFGGGESPVV
jgi:hypothetical protein